MRDSQRLISSIRDILSSASGCNAESVTPLAAEYARQVKAVSTRLSDAVGLYRRGLRSEAKQRCDIEPNLVDLAASLDFPELSDWEAVCQFLDVKLPPRLDFDAASELNEMYAETQSLEELLRRHRLYSIARASLRSRIKILRHIVVVDPGTSHWSDDLQEWEVARRKEIATELAHATSKGDLATLQDLQEELTRAVSITPAPPELIGRLSDAIEEVSLLSNREEQRLLAEQLNDAFCSLDVDEGKQIREKWLQSVGGVDDEVARPALEWLQEVESQEQQAEQQRVAIFELEDALERGILAGDVEKLYHACTAAEAEIAEPLLRRYESYIRNHDLAARRRMTAIIAIAAIVVLSAGGSVVALQRHWAFAATVEVASERIQAFLDQGDVAGAESYWSKLEKDAPRATTAEPLRDLRGRLDSARRKEDDRRQSFMQYLDLARTDAPHNTDLVALKRASDLATTEAEKQEVYKLEQATRGYEIAERKAADKKLSAVIDDVHARLENLSEQPAKLLDFEVLNGLSTQLEHAKIEYRGANPGALRNLEIVTSRLETQRARLEDYTSNFEYESRFAENLNATTSLSRFELLARNYVASSRKGILKDEFERALQEVDCWTSVLAYSNYVAFLRGAFSDGTTVNFTTNIGVILKLVTRKPKGPAWPIELSDPQGYLAAMKSRNDLRSDLSRRLEKSLLTRLNTVFVEEAGSGEQVVYYLEATEAQTLQAASKSGKKVSFRYLSDLDANRETKSANGASIRVLIQPQKHVAKLIQDLRAISVNSPTDWDRRFVLIVSDIVESRELDVRIKSLLLLELVATGSSGSDLLKSHWKSAHERLSGSGDADWLVPKPFQTVLSDSLLKAIAGRKELVELVKSHETQLMSSDFKAQWVGWVRRDINGHAEVSILDNIDAAVSGKLFVAVPEGDSGLSFHQIGELKNRHAELSINKTDPALLAGRVVFLLEGVTSSKIR